MSKWTAGLLSIALLSAGAPVLSEYDRMDIHRVPVAQLVQNFERQLAATPDDVSTLINLARLHALSCRSVEGDGVRFAAISARGVRFADGRTRPTYDVILRRATETSF